MFIFFITAGKVCFDSSVTRCRGNTGLAFATSCIFVDFTKRKQNFFCHPSESVHHHLHFIFHFLPAVSSFTTLPSLLHCTERQWCTSTTVLCSKKSSFPSTYLVFFFFFSPTEGTNDRLETCSESARRLWKCRTQLCLWKCTNKRGPAVCLRLGNTTWPRHRLISQPGRQHHLSNSQILWNELKTQVRTSRKETNRTLISEQLDPSVSACQQPGCGAECTKPVGTEWQSVTEHQIMSPLQKFNLSVSSL